jgi:hypothetical protein
MLSVVMLSVLLCWVPYVFILSVVMLNVLMLNVVAPFSWPSAIKILQPWQSKLAWIPGRNSFHEKLVNFYSRTFITILAIGSMS